LLILTVTETTVLIVLWSWHCHCEVHLISVEQQWVDTDVWPKTTSWSHRSTYRQLYAGWIKNVPTCF